MTNKYVWVSWNRHKRVYDALLWGAIATFLVVFVGLGQIVPPTDHAVDPMVTLIRGLGVSSFVLLHVILAIGPLARLDRRFAPLLYNRRHMGVSMFLLALAHAALTLVYYAGFGVRNPFSALLSYNTAFGSLGGFPFELLGAGALVILFAMAATSHDFWLANLSPRAWKWLHMLVYVAYALLVGHVALGVLRSEGSPVYAPLLAGGAGLLVALHVATGVRESRRDSAGGVPTDGWVDVCAVDEIPNARARVVCLAKGVGRGAERGERIAVFNDAGAISAVTNVCAHQAGPLGEGKIVDGCITCPWHGYQYRPTDGRSPPPFTENIATYRVRIVGERVQVDPRALAPGTPVEPARVDEERGASAGGKR